MITASEAKAMADKYNSRPFEVAYNEEIKKCFNVIEDNAKRGRSSCNLWVWLTDVPLSDDDVSGYFESLGYLVHGFKCDGTLLSFDIDWSEA